jgi:hypothetical protein
MESTTHIDQKKTPKNNVHDNYYTVILTSTERSIYQSATSSTFRTCTNFSPFIAPPNAFFSLELKTTAHHRASATRYISHSGRATDKGRQA